MENRNLTLVTESHKTEINYKEAQLVLVQRNTEIIGAQQQALLEYMTQSRRTNCRLVYRVSQVSEVANKHLGYQGNKQIRHTLI